MPDSTFGNVTWDGLVDEIEDLNVNVTEMVQNATEFVNKTELMEITGNATEYLANTTAQIEEIMPNMTDALIDLES